MLPFTLFFVAFVAEILGTIVGFGSSTIFMPLALYFLDFKTALVIVAFFHLFGNVGRVFWFWRNVDKNLLLYFGLPSIVFTVVAAFLVSLTDPAVLKFLLGLFLFVFSLGSLVMPQFRLKRTNINSLFGGVLSGFFAGIVGTGGALRATFFTAMNVKKNIYVATAAIIALLVDVSRVSVYFAQGFLTQDYYSSIPVFLIVAVAGSYVGKRIVHKVPQTSFRKIVLIAILLIGVKFVVDFASKI